MLKKLLGKVKPHHLLTGLLGTAGAIFIAGGLGVLMIKSGNIHNHILRNSVGSAVVKVTIPNKGGGSGFSTKAASGRLVIVTNEHVCALS
jgi:hypothetical protein